MKTQFAVLGLGRFGTSFALTLAENNVDVIAIDNQEKSIRDLQNKVTYALEGDVTDIEVLKEAGVGNVDVAVVSIGENIAVSIMVVMHLKELGIKSIIAKAVTDVHGKALKLLGVEKVVFPERDMARRVANNIVRPEFFEHLELSPGYRIVEIQSPKIFVGKNVMDTELRSKYGATLIAIRRDIKDGDETSEKWNINPLWSDMIKDNDTLIVLASVSDIDKLMNL